MAEDLDDFEPPFEPLDVPATAVDVVKKYCQNPMNGRLEWLQAIVTKSDLGQGCDMDEDMEDYVDEMDTNPMDEPAMIIHKSLGGKGDKHWNVFPEGKTFDREVYNNEVESTVYHGVNDSNGSATITIRFKFKNPTTSKAYKVCYRVELPNGDIIENDLLNA
uniref:Uncharacterized protein n=1 Tax=Compsopogon caeruleus TaxID=31354 RepID=A0A7S1XD43_9RHOD|mmetsp:Transcript_13923/g.28508  ORF Transcript_13923/g.28508 Transcript_13923/m.28508 type:complete len:162 (+) Transcript_13923:66-551(+)